MNFELNRLQNHHLDPRTRLNFAPVKEAADSATVEFDGDGSGGDGQGVEREHMFDKVVTPSDVGKLNRLVIPKQHAERFFPLDSSTNDKGLLLNFEDRNGKSWRFRYSYWNSSQSYVMTKGWSRFVKEKRLDAGDIVSFQRGVGEIGRDHLYIDWRRRPELPIDHLHLHHHPVSTQPSIGVPVTGTTTPWGSLVWHSLDVAGTGYNHYPVTAMHREMSQTNKNSNNNNINNRVNVMYDWNGGCCPYGYGSVEESSSLSEMVFYRTEGRRVSQRLGDELEGKNQVELEYFSSGGAGVGGSRVVQEELKTTRNTNYGEEDMTPVKRSRLRLFGVNILEDCDLLLSSSSSSNSNPKTTTQFQLPSPSTPPHHQS